MWSVFSLLAAIASRRDECSWDEEEFGGAAGKDLVPTGIARISFGAFSTPQDASSWIDFLRKFYVVPDLPLEINSSPTEDAFELDQVIVCTSSLGIRY